MNSTGGPSLAVDKVLCYISDAAWTETIMEDPEQFFNYIMGTLVATGVAAKAWPYLKSSKESSKDSKPDEIQSLQNRFLPVFYLLRMSFWMSGPYFFEVYSSKTLRHMDGTTSKATQDFVARVSLVGYLAIVVLGPPAGKLIDRYGRKTATLCTGLMYAIGSLSVFSDRPELLYAGRALASIASSRLTSTPEAWLISEYLSIQTKRQDEKLETKSSWLSEIFGMAYGGDAIVAIFAGQAASWAASFAGHPTGPFSMFPIFVGAAMVLSILTWAESKITEEHDETSNDKDTPINGEKATTNGDTCPKKSALKIVFSDSKIVLIGLIQSLFEGSMYIFVLVWPPIFTSAIQRVFGASSVTPFGTIFSCFMACSLLGSILFGQLQKSAVDAETTMVGMLMVSTIAFSCSVRAIQTQSLFALVFAFFAFEACVGMYFPSIGTIRIKLLPESHRSDTMALFAVPLNILVVGVMLFQSKLGHAGALVIATLGMGIATACMITLRWKLSEEERVRRTLARRNWDLAKKRIKSALKIKSTLEKSSSRRFSDCEMRETATKVREFQRRSSYVAPAF